MNAIAIGNHIRPVSCSLKSLGYETFSISYFNDLDIRMCSREVYAYLSNVIETESLRKNKDNVEKFFKEKFNEILNKKDIKIVIPKRNRDFIEKSGIEVISNSYNVQKRAENKINLYKACERLGINIPKYMVTNKKSRIISFVEEVKSAVLKPAEGSHGNGIFFVNERNIYKIVSKINTDEYIVQEFISGDSFNINLVRGLSKPLYVSMQIVGDSFFGARDFLYCGNVGYVKVEKEKEILNAFLSLGEYFGIRGIYGGDFIIKNGNFYIVDLNPRIQGSYDCIEMSYGENPLKIHIKDFFEEKIDEIKLKFFSGRAILYARENCKVKDSLGFENIRDVPEKGVMIKKGEPICTVVAKSEKLEEVFLKMRKIAKKIYEKKIETVDTC